LKRAASRQWGQTALDPMYPFFPLHSSGLEGLGPEAMHHVAELELGGAEELIVRHGGQELGDGPEVRFGGGLERLVELLGATGLVLGEMLERHDGGPP
jgi:hypothetical protein